MARWLSTGQFHVINVVDDTSLPRVRAVVGHFNPCSTLPLIQCHILGIEKTAIIDSGAAKSLLSSSVAQQIWGDNFQAQLTHDCNCQLKDVNYNIIATLGTKNVNFSINLHHFNFDFIIYQSLSNELLLGYDFLRSNNLGIFPNLGLIKTDTLINNIISDDPLFILKTSENVDIYPGAQQLVNTYIDHGNNRNISALLNQQNVLAHSQILEPDQEWEKLTVFFQYVRIQADLSTQILVINDSEFILHLNADQHIAHAELIHQIAQIQHLTSDPFASIFMTQINLIEESVKSQSIVFPEEKICIDPPEDSQFDAMDINCHSQDPSLINWLTQLHLKYKQIFL